MHGQSTPGPDTAIHIYVESQVGLGAYVAVTSSVVAGLFLKEPFHDHLAVLASTMVSRPLP